MNLNAANKQSAKWESYSIEEWRDLTLLADVVALRATRQADADATTPLGQIAGDTLLDAWVDDLIDNLSLKLRAAQRHAEVGRIFAPTQQR